MISKETSALNTLLELMDSAVTSTAHGVKKACISWLAGVPRSVSANEPTYHQPRVRLKRYRNGAKKRAGVRTIRSLLSRKCQNVLSEEIGAGAAWLLGLWPKATRIPGAKTLTSPQMLSESPICCRCAAAPRAVGARLKPVQSL